MSIEPNSVQTREILIFFARYKGSSGMSIEPNSVQTPVTNAATMSETIQSEWPQLKPHKPSVYFPNSPTSPSSWGDIKHQTYNTQAEDQFIQRVSAILTQFVPQMNRQAFPPDLNILAEFVVHGASSFPVPLVSALHDLQEATDEAHEEGFPPPSDVALENADRFLREMYRISPRRFEVYPTPDGEIAIDAPGGHGRSVLVLCDSEGGALCLVNMNGDHRRARYSTTERLPDGFMREALAELERSGD